MDPIERIASMLDEELMGAEIAPKAPVARKVVPFVFEHLSQVNSEELKFERIEGDSILFNVVIDGTTHQYKMKVENASSSKPGQTDPAAARAAQMRRGAAQSY